MALKRPSKSTSPTRACYLCAGENFETVSGKVRDRPDLGILRCTACGLVFLENFKHIDADYYDKTYPQGNHEATDWQQFLNACSADDKRRADQLTPLILNRRLLDVGCGAGGLLLNVKDKCEKASGIEPQTRWKNALLSKGITVYSSLDEIKNESVDVLSMFHVLEHIPDPIDFLKNAIKKVIPGGQLVIEVPNANDALLQLYKSRSFSEFTYWSPHLYLYTPHTLGRLLEKVQLTDFTIRQFQRYPLSNHLYWLCNEKPGGHQKWSFIDTPALTQAYADTLAAMGLCDTLISIVTLKQK